MGRHQPPTNRSFYLSVAASTIRFAIVVALVVGGVLLINQAFPESATIGGGGGPPATSPSVSTSPTEEPPENTNPEPSPTIAGTVIVVMNASGVDGLAGDTTDRLVNKYDYEGLEPGTAPSLLDTTTIYYVKRNKDKVEAEFLANDFFKKIKDSVLVAKLPADQNVDASAQLVIFIGTDYAATVG